MKRNIAIATVVAAALVGGGTATAFAAGGGWDDSARPAAKSSPASGVADRADEAEEAEEARETAEAVDAAKVDFGRAVDAAVKAVPGTVVGAELENEEGEVTWGVETLDAEGVSHEVTVDARSGKVSGTDREREKHAQQVLEALQGARLDAKAAVKAATQSVRGTVTGVDFDVDEQEGTSAWEVALLGKDGKVHEMEVDPATGSVSEEAPE
ncbi:PepSY domain-containing protein [Streptomyces sp. URMC 123]|uniref:PepSY domain-containing protein n=1 Tax=Streptomyces sp. URMC 123 TaxID=3423403 RepID=UPI003F1A7D35